MTREEAISEWTFRSNHIKKWLDEYGEEPSIRHYVELIDMAISALTEEEKLKEQLANCHKEILRLLDLNMLTEDENEVVEKNDEVIDLISRADAIEAVARDIPFITFTEDYRRTAERIIGTVPSAEQVTSKLNNPCDSLLTDDSAECKEHKSKLESADAVQGEWIMHIDDLFPCESTQECSVCHAEQPISISDDNYCPSCGARMFRKESEVEE